MAHFRRLALTHRNFALKLNHERATFRAVVMEIAHALSRGRRPTSTSLLPNANLQEWLRSTFSVAIQGYYNDLGRKCSIAEVEEEFARWHRGPDEIQLLKAIRMCRAYVRASKRPKGLRGKLLKRSIEPLPQPRRRISDRREHISMRRPGLHGAYD